MTDDSDAPIEARLRDPRPAVRQRAAVDAARTQDASVLPQLIELAKCDPAQAVRRECASSVGRLSRILPQAFAALAELSRHDDPGVVLQAARGLVAARDDNQRAVADPILAKLARHKNEVVQDFVRVERMHTARVTATNRRTKRGGGGSASPGDDWRNVLIRGDAIEALKRLPPEIVHLTFTSPPYYNARDYSTYRSYEEYLEFLTNVFSEVHSVTAEGRFLVVNTSPVIVPRAGRQHESHRYAIPFDLHPRLTKLGWKFIDDIIWQKPEGAAKPRNSGFNVHRQPLTYKANAVTEYVMVYRKWSHHLIDWNLRQYNREMRAESEVPDGYETSNVWQIDPATDRVHSAVFPKELCNRVIQYYSMKGDLVLDPFAGSGTVAAAAQELERDVLLIEVNDEYADRIQQKMKLDSQLRRVNLEDWPE